MTIDLQNIKKLFVGNQELKKLYKGDELIWQAGEMDFDYYPRGIWADEDNNFYVLVHPTLTGLNGTEGSSLFKILKFNSAGVKIAEFGNLGANTNYDFTLYLENSIIYTGLGLKSFKADTGAVDIEYNNIFEVMNHGLVGNPGALYQEEYYLRWLDHNAAVALKSDSSPSGPYARDIKRSKSKGWDYFMSSSNVDCIEISYCAIKTAGSAHSLWKTIKNATPNGIAFDFDESNNFYILSKTKLTKYSSTGVKVWETALSATLPSMSGSLVLIGDYVAYLAGNTLCIVRQSSGVEVYRESVATTWANGDDDRSKNLLLVDPRNNQKLLYLNQDDKTLGSLDTSIF